ncbi:hypothetical protein PIB30_022154 [Stylosanthes scabra]|uniref:Uncharacterized protein n=1 Tax=Stylosanthes scabra TaxID=79078 RepID=A0ABU6V9A4_9FABA|nr:hypothetical protein [Stylosanthes scabra]
MAALDQPRVHDIRQRGAFIGSMSVRPVPLYLRWLLHRLRTVYPLLRTPMSDARRYRSLFSRRRVAPPTPPPPSPPPSDDEPSVETFDPAAELEGDPNEPYIAEHVPIDAPEAYYSDASYGPEHESASTDSTPSSHHLSGSVSLGYGSASSGSASDGASDDDLVNRYFARTFLRHRVADVVGVSVLVPHQLLVQYEV